MAGAHSHIMEGLPASCLSTKTNLSPFTVSFYAVIDLFLLGKINTVICRLQDCFLCAKKQLQTKF